MADLYHCSVCTQKLPREEFYADTSRGTGVSSRCRKCEREHFKRRYWADPESSKRRKTIRKREQQLRDVDRAIIRAKRIRSLRNADPEKVRAAHPRGEANPKCKLSDAQVAEIRRRAAGGDGRRGLATEYGVSRSTIRRIVTGESRAENNDA